MKRIAIIGGGPGGLFAALRLLQAKPDLQVTVLEASERFGGKIRTGHVDGVPYEAGTAELYGYDHIGADPLKDLITGYDLTIKPMERKSMLVMRGKALQSAGELSVEAGKQAEAYYKACSLFKSPQQYFSWAPDNDHPWAQIAMDDHLDLLTDPDARAYVLYAMHSDLACEPQQTSALYGSINALLDNKKYMQLYHVVGGIEQLIARLLDDLVRRDCDLRLQSPVTLVERARNGVWVQSAGRKELFDAVICAVPNYFLPGIKWRPAELRDRIAAHCAHYENPAHYYRCTLLFERPFWRGEMPGAFTITDGFDGCCIYDDGERFGDSPLGVPLSWLIAGDAAQRASDTPNDMLMEECIRSLPETLHEEARRYLLDWTTDGFIGTVNAVPGGWLNKDDEEAHRMDARVLLVGDYLYDSTLNGVLHSAEVAVSLLLGKPLTTNCGGPGSGVPGPCPSVKDAASASRRAAKQSAKTAIGSMGGMGHIYQEIGQRGASAAPKEGKNHLAHRAAASAHMQAATVHRVNGDKKAAKAHEEAAKIHDALAREFSQNVLTVNPFVSEVQRRACYAGAMPGVDCAEWESETKGKLPKRKNKPTTNAIAPNRFDPTRTTTLRRMHVAKVSAAFKALRKRLIAIVREENAFAVTANCNPGQLRGADGKCGYGIGVDIPREQMPQIAKDDLDDFLTFASDNGIEWKRSNESPATLKPTQANFRQERVDAIRESRAHEDDDNPLITSVDDYVLDGTHRWIAARQEKSNAVATVKLSAPLQKCLEVMRKYPRVKFAVNTRWQFSSDPQKIEQFAAWLKANVADTVLSDDMEKAWEEFARQGMLKGVGRAFDDANANGAADLGEKMPFYGGSKAQFLKGAFGTPVATEKLKLLASRSFTDLKNVTDDMATKMRRELMDGLAQGDNPREIGDRLSDVLDISESRAETIARTEIIRAHAEGQLIAMKAMGIDKVGVQVEFSTAGDDRVCPDCEELEGSVYSVDESSGIIPVHPQCRCSWLPYLGDDEEEPTENVKRLKEKAAVLNAFCATGPGGGQDNSCSAKGSGGKGGVLASLFKGVKSIFAGAKAGKDSKEVAAHKESAKQYTHQIDKAKTELSKAGIKDMWGTDLQKSAALRHMAVSDPAKFDSMIAKLQLTLKTAAKYGKDNAAAQKSIGEKLDQLNKLQQDVNAFRKGAYKAPANKPNVAEDEVHVFEHQHFGKLGAKAKNASIVLDHLGKGGSAKDAVKKLIAGVGYKESTAKKYVRRAIHEAAHLSEEAKLHHLATMNSADWQYASLVINALMRESDGWDILDAEDEAFIELRS